MALLVALCALPARGEESVQSLQVVHTMTSIDASPTRAELSALLGGGNELVKLGTYALDPMMDFGVRLRAVRAMPHFCPDQPAQCHDAIMAVFQSIGQASDPPGQKLLRLRATIEALGEARSGLPEDRQLLLDHLGHGSADVRVAVVRALRSLCDLAVLPALKSRFAIEPSRQVKVAISQAVGAIEQCGP